MMKNIDIVLKANEEKIIPFVWINGEETEVTVNATLSGDGATLRIIGIFLGTQNNSITFNTNVIHKASHTKSLTSLRGVFLNRSSFSNDGLVSIFKGAKSTDGYFASKILLFDDAKGRSVPSLEIDENEVKAGHASTVGRPDEEQLFYLQSRGLSEKAAEKLIISGFFEPLLLSFSRKEKTSITKKIQSLL